MAKLPVLTAFSLQSSALVIFLGPVYLLDDKTLAQVRGPEERPLRGSGTPRGPSPGQCPSARRWPSSCWVKMRKADFSTMSGSVHSSHFSIR